MGRFKKMCPLNCPPLSGAAVIISFNHLKIPISFDLPAVVSLFLNQY